MQEMYYRRLRVDRLRVLRRRVARARLRTFFLECLRVGRGPCAVRSTGRPRTFLGNG
jgi:hypothetical protein